MENLLEYIHQNKIDQLLEKEESDWITTALSKYENFQMSIEDMWNLLDEVWFELGCTQNSDEQELSKYYSHPVWVLNGIHIENNPQSLQAREKFTSWIIEKKFKRIADFGGGFGTLGRMINSKDPSIEINIIEPNYQRFVDK